MKIISVSLTLVLLFGLFSCQPSKEEASIDPAKFVQFGFHQWEKGSFDCNKFKENCAVVKLNYPKAVFGDEKVRTAINEKVDAYVSTELSKAIKQAPQGGKSVTHLAESALAGYDSEDKAAFAEVSVFGQVMFRNKDFIKVELSSFLKSNDGKVKSNRSLYTFDSREGKVLSETILNNGEPKLAEVSMK